MTLDLPWAGFHICNQRVSSLRGLLVGGWFTRFKQLLWVIQPLLQMLIHSLNQHQWGFSCV